MPSIDLSALRARTRELAGLLAADAPAFRAGVRALMEIHAHRLLRRGPSMAQRGALLAWDVPGLLMRELDSTLIPAAATDPAAALAAADALWPEGRLEERLLAARLAGTSADVREIRKRVAQWSAGLSDPALTREIADTTCRPFRRADPDLFRADARKWIEAEAPAIRRFGWAALGAWLTDGGIQAALAAFDLLPRALREDDPETLRAAGGVVAALAQSTPAEIRKWIEDLPPDPLYRGRAFLRSILAVLPDPLAGELKERLRAGR
jgi:hypothetical protein